MVKKENSVNTSFVLSVLLAVLVTVLFISKQYLTVIDHRPDNNTIIETANGFVCGKLGAGYCSNYVRNDYVLDTMAGDGSVYYLHYNVTIPQKGINTTFQIAQKSDLTKPREIDLLPDCSAGECDFLSKSEIEDIISSEMSKYGFINNGAQIYLKFEQYGSENPSRWIINYPVPQEKTPQCTDFNLGGVVYMEIAAISGDVMKNEFNCVAPGT